jgi:hypothetical protein
MIQKVLLIADDEEDNGVIFFPRSSPTTVTPSSWPRTAGGRGARPRSRAPPHPDGPADAGPGRVEGPSPLRDDPQTADIPVIAVTAADQTAARLEEAGFCAYIRKPVEPQDLVRAVEFCLERVGEGAPWIELPSLDAASPSI